MVAAPEQEPVPGKDGQDPCRAGVLRGAAVVGDVPGDEEDGVRTGLEMGRTKPLQPSAEDSVVFWRAAKVQIADVGEFEHGKASFPRQRFAGKPVRCAGVGQRMSELRQNGGIGSNSLPARRNVGSRLANCLTARNITTPGVMRSLARKEKHIVTPLNCLPARTDFTSRVPVLLGGKEIE